MFRFRAPHELGWRLVDGCALIVRRRGGSPYWLSREATAVWLSGTGDHAHTAAHRPVPMSTLDADDITILIDTLDSDELIVRDVPARTGAQTVRSPFVRRVTDIAEVAVSIGVTPGVRSFPVGAGFSICTPDGAVLMLSGGDAAVWRRLLAGPTTFATLLDDALTRDRTGAERALDSGLLRLDAHRAIEGIERLQRYAGRRHSPGRVTTLAAMSRGDAQASLPSGGGAVIRDAGGPADHVAIVCQYGIAGLAAGVHGYVKRCIGRLATLAPDLVIVSGGGRHGLSDLREAESVIARYRQQLPGPALWMENYSRTTWENLLHSLEMLAAREIRPRRVSFVGDAARADKLRVACWLARRRFPAFRDVSFRVVPIRRARATWRDTRTVQVAVGCVQTFAEARRLPRAEQRGTL